MVYPATRHALKTCSKLIDLLPSTEQAKPQILLLAGEVTPFRNDTDRELVFRQESNFYYLTGCTVPSSYVLITFQSGTSLSQKPNVELFIPEISEADLMWSVPPPTKENALETHDVASVAYPEDVVAAIETHLKAFPDALFHTLPRDSPLFPNLPAEYTQLVQTSDAGAITDAYLLDALHKARLIKDEEEIALIRKANAISSRAHETVMRVLGLTVKNHSQSNHTAVPKNDNNSNKKALLPGEWLIEKEAEAETIFVASCRREGSIHQSYLPIVASATRASTLHYCCNDREFAWGPINPHDHLNREAFAQGKEKSLVPQVLLIDAGCEWNCYASDITRTMPVGNGGKFTKEAGEIYDLVLEMQNEAMGMLKPGVHWDAVHFLCHRILVKRFLELGILRGGDEGEVLSSGVSAAFFPHGLGHSLGMDVHDVPSASKPEKNETIKGSEKLGHQSFYSYLRLRIPLEAGMVVTVEPGCYFAPHLLKRALETPASAKYIDTDVLKRYEPVGGVRIEDVVLVTPDGYENLTTVKSERAWVEGVCSGEL